MIKNLLTRLFAGVLLLCGMPLCALAEDSGSDSEVVYYLKVVENTGGELTIPFSEKPEISYKDDALVLVSENTEVEYPTGTLDYFTITTTPSESGIVMPEQVAKAALRINGETIHISNATPGKVVTVASIDGAVVAIGKIDANGEAVMTVPAQKGGIYIVNTGTSTFKYIKK